jgi:hypothetical protein
MSFAMVFLSCRGDASAAVDQSEVDITHRIASSFDQHASLLKHQCSHLFDYRRPRRVSNQAGVSLSQIADPTTRRGGSVARRAGDSGRSWQVSARRDPAKCFWDAKTREAR